jgi:hypothetical protein
MRLASRLELTVGTTTSSSPSATSTGSRRLGKRDQVPRPRAAHNGPQARTWAASVARETVSEFGRSPDCDPMRPYQAPPAARWFAGKRMGRRSFGVLFGLLRIRSLCDGRVRAEQGAHQSGEEDGHHAWPYAAIHTPTALPIASPTT